MGTARSLLYTISSIVMIIAGTGSIACAILLPVERLSASDASMPLTFLTAVIMLIYSIINIISGIQGVRYHNKRINSAVMLRLPVGSVAFCLAAMILSLFNGIMTGYLLAMILTGLLPPLLFIYTTARKSSL